MTKTEQIVDFVGRTLFRGTLIILCSYIGANLARADMGKSVEASKIRNLIMKPDYTESSDGDETTDGQAPKLQFEPMNDDLPLLEDRHIKEEFTSGVIYPEGTDTIVAPDSNIVTSKDEIVEKPNTEPVFSPDDIEDAKGK